MALSPVIEKGISSRTDIDGLIAYEQMLRQRGAWDVEVALAIAHKGRGVARSYVEQQTGLALEDLTSAEKMIVDVVCDYVLIKRRAGTNANRTLRQIRDRGLIGAVETSVSQFKPTQGFKTLEDEARSDITYEQIITRFPDEFSEKAIWFAKRRLNVPTDFDRPPAEADGRTQERTAALIGWLKSRALLGNGRIAPYDNSEAAAAMGIGDPKYGRVHGNIQSRIDFACYKVGLPPLGLTATAPFKNAWAQEGHSWKYPVASMAEAARSRIWPEEDFASVLRAAEALPGQGYYQWRQAIENNESAVRSWAYGLKVQSHIDRHPEPAGFAESTSERAVNVSLTDADEAQDDGEEWSDSELFAAVDAYINMLAHEKDGLAYNKAAINRQLREGPLAGRSKGSIEFRMQNISATLHGLSLPWIRGYKPADNVGAGVKERLANILARRGVFDPEDYKSTDDENLLSQRVGNLRSKGLESPPPGISTPSKSSSTATTYVRSPVIKAWVLENANGICEGCGEAAPFPGKDGRPYLEVHHVKTLANNGSDSVSNAVALCPNCHRRCHLSEDSNTFSAALYGRIERLVKEADHED